jgi:hypothetical protein
MGFDLHIVMLLMIDEKTGLPLTHTAQVPEKYRKFLNQKGPWFSNYVAQFDGIFVSAERFLEEYPEWNDILSDDEWSQKNHEEFKEALVWFAEKGFNLLWSY